MRVAAQIGHTVWIQRGHDGYIVAQVDHDAIIIWATADQHCIGTDGDFGLAPALSRRREGADIVVYLPVETTDRRR